MQYQGSRGFQRFLGTMICASLSLLTTAGFAADLTDGVTFYASFDGQHQPPEANYAAGSFELLGPTQRAEGRVGQAFVSEGEPLSLYTRRNFDQGKGTLSLWVRLDQPALEAEGRAPTLIGLAGGNFRFRIIRHSKRVCFMTGDSPPQEDFQWSYGCSVPVTDFPAQRWAHVTLTWDASQEHRAVYVDGKPGAETSSHLMRKSGSGRELEIGGVPGRYDELIVWDRVLSPEEIRELSMMPGDVANRLSQLTRERRWDMWPAKMQLVYKDYTDALVEPGEPFKFELPIVNDTDQAAQATVDVQLLDVWSQVVEEAEPQQITLQPGEKRLLPMQFTVDDYGFYVVSVTTTVDGEQLLRDVTTFGCLPAGVPPRHEFFGGHINRSGTMAKMGRQIGFAGNRVHNMTQFTWWKRMQPEPDEWTINEWNYEHFKNLGYHNYGQWFAAPYWAVTLPDGTQPAKRTSGYPKPWVPTDDEALATYVKRSLKEFPEIELWEIWNEPYVGTFWSGSVEQYVDLARKIYTTAKAERPDITVFSQLSPDGGWIKAALKNGIMKYCDGVAWHSYRRPGTTPQTIRNQVNRLRSLIAEYGGVENADEVPLVMSEGGAGGDMVLRGIQYEFPEAPLITDLTNARDAAIQHVQSSVIWMSMGVWAQYYYLHQPVTPDNITRTSCRVSTVEITNTPRPLAIAQAVLVRMIDGGTYAREVSRKNGNIRFYLYKRSDGKTLVVAWAENGATATVAPVGEAFDLMGNSIADASQGVALDAEPLYMVAEQSVDAVADALNETELRDYQAVERSEAEEALIQQVNPWVIAAEVGPARLHPVDLRGHLNMGLQDDAAGDGKGGWLDEGPFNDMRMIERGRHEWLGVPFEIYGQEQGDPAVLTMRGKTFPTGPEQVAIPVDHERFRGIFFAHAANYATSRKNGEQIGEYVVRYDDGTEQTIPLIVGYNIFNWWNGPHEGEESRAVMFVHPNPQRAGQENRYIRTWYWSNPWPEKSIDEIIVRSMTDDRSTFTLVGITIAGGR